MRKLHASSRNSNKQRRHPLSSRAVRFIMVQVLVLAIGHSAIDDSLAANTGAVYGSSSDVYFSNVPADGISYTNYLDTINVGGGTAIATTVDTGTIGINLARTGVTGTASTVEIKFITIKFDTDNNAQTPEQDVISFDSKNPYLVDEVPGNYIIVLSYDKDNKPSTFKIGTDPKIFSDTELADYLFKNSAGSGAAISGSLTVNNNSGPLMQGAPFSTMKAKGIVVSSEGGRGGNGGSYTVLFYGWGTRGSDGGNAGSVVVNSNSKITVNSELDSAAEKYGIEASSRGGNGGDGGGMWGAVSDPGSGGNGGNGGEVYVTLGTLSDITTYGAKCYGVFAQSQGGDGGSGGSSDGLGALGSKGGNGGDSGKVEVSNAGMIHTSGVNSHGIYARSVGAGAGSGSSADGLFYAAGGDGGGESDGNTVQVTNSGTITTDNTDAFGIIAQSIGGGGGDGGGSGGWIYKVGGRGGSGGGSKAVTVYDSGTLRTLNDRSTAIFAQSIGGGGGNGGNAISFSPTAVSIAVGGNGGPGGKGDNVTIVANGSDIYTGSEVSRVIDGKSQTVVLGDESCGILAQSVGGGGGNGGLAISGNVSLLPTSGVNVSIALGGNGDHGGDAGDQVWVTTTATTNIHTMGISAQGISAQSIGGGGGNGGAAVSAITGSGLNVAVALGGSGKGGGDGKNVLIDNAAKITTTGDHSAGIQAQSIGGGGGNGGFSGALAIGAGAVSVTLGGDGGGGGTSGLVDVANSNTIHTLGQNSVGILAQSIGGGGGNGGGALSGSAGVLSLSTAIGGKGGTGKYGAGDVVVDNSGDVLTEGGLSYGIFAQSVGGGGGNGGYALAATLAVSLEEIPAVGAAISVGGSGGGGTDGGDVTVNIDGGSINTLGAGAHAVYAQSVGGGGGNGGFAGSLAIAAGDGASLGIAIGGAGESGGNAGEVHVNSDGTSITTHQDGSDGIHAQSVGGSGGDGGFAFSGTAAVGGTNLSASVAIGGKGSNGGDGNIVDVANSAKITTSGDHANGLFAQSIGGGGGNGGLSVAGSVTGSVSFGVNVGVAVGGKGGVGGSAKEVFVDDSADISTSGGFSHAIMAQSVGGAGGNGGLSITAGLSAAPSKSLNAKVTVGGPGGTGGFGGDVYVGYDLLGFDNNGKVKPAMKATSGTLLTTGDNAAGIFAQSVGGSGGQGGSSLACTFTNDSGKSTSVTSTLTFGGSGGDGNEGGDVFVASNSDIKTTGDNSNGIQAQSIGGGGGMGGSTQAINLTASGALPFKEFEGTNYALALNVGGDGGNASSGGIVTVVNTGTIETKGVLSRGISAQSVGGGGGSVAEGILGDVGDWTDGAQNVLSGIGTAKAIADSFKKKSVDGLKPNSLTLTIGGNGGNDGNAQAVDITNAGEIFTHGMGSHAIFAQSIGGGGGEAQVYAKGTGDGEDVGVGVGLVGEFVIGGKGGAAGNGGTVTVTNAGGIEVWGEAANGIYAQSIGGGGGQAGAVSGGFSDFSSIGLGVGFGHNGGSGGNGADVSVNNSGNIVTHGISGVGIFTQSVGGGGGIVGDVGGIAFAGSIGGYGKSGKVSIDQKGDITTFGTAAHGIFAQSVGGYAGTNKTNVYLDPTKPDVSTEKLTPYEGGADNVTVTYSGTVDTQGENSVGILLQSKGGTSNGDLTVNLNSGVVNGGSGKGSGIHFLDGAKNTLNNSGTIFARSGIAVVGGDGGETISNNGTIIGNVDLGGGANTFNNNKDGVLNSGASVNIGIGNSFTNVGTFSPGGQHTLQTTTLTGNLVQTDSGALKMEVDRLGNHDKLVVASGSATLGGELILTKGPGPYINGTTYDLLETTDDTISGKFGSMSLPASTPILSYLVNQTANKVSLEFEARKISSLTTNPADQALAGYLDRILPTSTGDLNNVLGVLQELSLPELERAFSSLGPATYDGLTRTAMSGMFQGQNSLRQRLSNVRAFSLASAAYGGETKPVLLAYNGPDAYLGRFLAEEHGRRVVKRNDFWLNGYSQWGNHQGADGIPGYDYKIYGSTFGYDYCYQNRAVLGLSFGFSNADVDYDDNLGNSAIRGSLGSLYGSFYPGDAFVEASFSYGRERFHNTRNLTIGSLLREASSEHDGSVYALYLGGGYNFNFKDLVVSPFGALRYVHLDEDAFTESGASSLNLSVNGRSSESFISELGVRAGYEFKCKDSSLIPEISAALNYDFNVDNRIITSSFAESPGSMFSIHGQDTGRCGADVTASLTYVHKNGFAFSMKYNGEFRDRNSANGIMGEIRYMF